MLPVRAFGQYGVRIIDSRRFLIRLVGTLPLFDASRLSDYFRSTLMTRIKTEIANAIITNGQSVLEVSTELGKLSEMLRAALSEDMATYGGRVGPGISPRASHRTGRETLASSGSCHPVKATAFHHVSRSSRRTC
jgi:membrane protease subunit (stomatin/prohibitin family)